MECLNSTSFRLGNLAQGSPKTPQDAPGPPEDADLIVRLTPIKGRQPSIRGAF